MAQTSSHRTLVTRLMDCWNSGQLSAIDEILAPNFVRHGDYVQGTREIRGPAAYKQVVEQFHKLLSNFQSEAHDVVEQGDKIAFRFHTRGIHNGQPIEFEGANIMRVESGKIVEDWTYYDATGLAARLGTRKVA